jgi:hypothetical protein
MTCLPVPDLDWLGAPRSARGDAEQGVALGGDELVTMINPLTMPPGGAAWTILPTISRWGAVGQCHGVLARSAKRSRPSLVATLPTIKGLRLMPW